VVGEVGDSQVVVNLPVTNVPGCIGSNAKKLGLQYLHLPDMGVCDCPPNVTRIVHHGTDELLIQQNTIPDGETASPVQERSKRSQSLCRFLPHLFDMLRPVEPFMKGNSKTTGDVHPLDWLPKELYCSGVLDTPTSLGQSIAELFEALMAILHSLNHRSRSLRCLQVFDEERWLTRRGYDGHIVRIEPALRGGKARAYRSHTG